LEMRLYMIYSHDHVAWRAGCEASQTLKDSELIKDLGQALGAAGLRSVRWKHIYIYI
jgi:hypothetical protein